MSQNNISDLYDTPTRELFNMAKRTFSSGCIRIEEPIELAAYLLQENTTKHIFSSQILPKSNPPGINMNKIGAWVVSNSSGL
jgi:murein L,D-transpeptidase YcbB/YkuD